MVQGAQQQFIAAAFDQFHQAMATLPAITWSASSGTVSTAGLFTAPGAGTAATVTAKSGGVTGTATVTLTANNVTPQNTTVAALVQSLDADGSISRNDMIEILESVAADGPLSAANFAALKTMLTEAGTLNIPNYVQVLAGDVINGNPANVTYQGQALGNLAAGSSSTVAHRPGEQVVHRHRRPALCNTSLVYKSVTGSLFPHHAVAQRRASGRAGRLLLHLRPGHAGRQQPASSREHVHQQRRRHLHRPLLLPAPTESSTTNGTISAGFTTGVGTADYVTVNCMLPTSASGVLDYADSGASYTNAGNGFWIPLAEKAYAQWNQTGREGPATASTPTRTSRAAGWPRSMPRCLATTPPITS